MKILAKISLLILISLSQYSFVQAQTSENPPLKNWLKISTNLENFYLVVDDDFKNSFYLTSGDSILLPVGRHELRIVWRNINDFTTSVTIVDSRTTSRRIVLSSFMTRPTASSYQILENQQNVNVVTDAESEIFLDGDYVGTEYTELFLNPGKYKIHIIHPVHGSLKRTLKIDPQKYISVARFNENPNPLPFGKKLIPGYSYLSNKQYKKAALTYSGLILLTGAALLSNSDYNRKNNLFQSLNREYLTSNNSQRVVALREEIQGTLNEMDELNTRITAFTLGAVTWYALTTLDGLRKPKDGYPGNISVQPQFSYHDNSPYPKVSLNIDF
ncbi:MAG: hypothetical protein ACMZ7B_07200 [Balneola sp.]